MSDKTMMRVSKATNRKLLMLKAQHDLGSAEESILYILKQNLLLQSRIDNLLDQQ